MFLTVSNFNIRKIKMNKKQKGNFLHKEQFKKLILAFFLYSGLSKVLKNKNKIAVSFKSTDQKYFYLF